MVDREPNHKGNYIDITVFYRHVNEESNISARCKVRHFDVAGIETVKALLLGRLKAAKIAADNVFEGNQTIFL
jgi:hypothetical protein